MVLLRLLTTIVRLDCGKELHDICHALIGVMHLVLAGAELGSRVSQIALNISCVAGAERGSRVSQIPLHRPYQRVRAPEVAPCVRQRVLELLHGLAEIVDERFEGAERGSSGKFCYSILCDI